MVVFVVASGVLPCQASLEAIASLAIAASLALLIRTTATGQLAGYLTQGCRIGLLRVLAMPASAVVRLELMVSATEPVPLFLVLVKIKQLLHSAQCKYE